MVSHTIAGRILLACALAGVRPLSAITLPYGVDLKALSVGLPMQLTALALDSYLPILSELRCVEHRPCTRAIWK